MLREEAYVAARLKRQLEEQAVRFLSDAAATASRRAGWRCRRSSTGSRKTSARQAYFARYASRLGYRGEVPLSFLDYDWSLNDFRSYPGAERGAGHPRRVEALARCAAAPRGDRRRWRTARCDPELAPDSATRW